MHSPFERAIEIQFEAAIYKLVVISLRRTMSDCISYNLRSSRSKSGRKLQSERKLRGE
ncbi:hypothetical protein HanIR_Chr02g0085761 [Helianthus annuus]|nr:hypothetical protein HanIR_Chr02g0085761 [Helianthus annuus]